MHYNTVNKSKESLMKNIKSTLIHFLLNHSRFYYQGQEMDLSPEAKAVILKNIWKTAISELRQEFNTNKY